MATLGAIEPQQPNFIKVYDAAANTMKNSQHAKEAREARESSAKAHVNPERVTPLEQEIANIRHDYRLSNILNEESKSFIGDISQNKTIVQVTQAINRENGGPLVDYFQ